MRAKRGRRIRAKERLYVMVDETGGTRSVVGVRGRREAREARKRGGVPLGIAPINLFNGEISRRK